MSITRLCRRRSEICMQQSAALHQPQDRAARPQTPQQPSSISAGRQQRQLQPSPRAAWAGEGQLLRSSHSQPGMPLQCLHPQLRMQGQLHRACRSLAGCLPGAWRLCLPLKAPAWGRPLCSAGAQSSESLSPRRPTRPALPARQGLYLLPSPGSQPKAVAMAALGNSPPWAQPGRQVPVAPRRHPEWRLRCLTRWISWSR